MIKIIIIGEGGQGVKLLGNVMANILASIGKHVTLTYSYDAAVRGGNITANLIYSDEKIDNPIIDTSDILLMLSETEGISTKKMIMEKTLFKEGYENIPIGDITKIPLITLSSEKFGSPIFINMIALGQLLKKVEIDITQINLERYLPEKFLEKNLEAIRYGYTWQE
ncbi:2-oxoacid:acceptor oxidoreductase family protein [Candidatus Woesearchaeota archaeon]|nr:2-oxoacid:acceptor oxidoreductase family protein [Candidatus Woesearchaeota archaeon]